ncbi:MAG: restriction endonuclease [Thermotogae bacterium]|nr:restriction endonuclease [Thermotogota bacterium]
MDAKFKKKMKDRFLRQLQLFTKDLRNYISTHDNQWAIKGFIDIFKNIYTLTSDTKIISKVIEIHLFPKFVEFSKKYGYKIVVTDKQNWYPDITFISIKDERIKFALDLKTTYITKYKDGKPYECNGFTLGSHGTYFVNRRSTKNIQFPYSEYLGHYVLGIIYERNDIKKIDETKRYNVSELESIPSVAKNFIFFAHEKWRIASDKSGSGNTANIGSVKKIKELLEGKGVFWQYFGEDGEKWFDEYWMNYGKIIMRDSETGQIKKITSLSEFLKFKGLTAKKSKKEEI